MSTGVYPTRDTSSKLDRIPYTPLLHLVTILATVVLIAADFYISLRNLTINEHVWSQLHDYLPWLYAWAGAQYGVKRFSAWKPEDVPGTASSMTAPAFVTTRSEASKPPASGQPAAPVVVEERDEPPRAAPMARPSHAG
jgi:hypothetical protein